MSIVALKRNSQRYLSKVSHNQGSNGFALNGGLRNAGWVGQTSLGRIGSANSFCVYQDPSIVKKSVKNTLGVLTSTIRYPVSAGCESGKCDPLHSSMNAGKKSAITDDHTASGQTAEIVNSLICAGSNAVGCNNTDSVINNPTAFKSALACPPAGCRAGSHHIGGRFVYDTPYNKDVSSFSAMTAGDYIRRLKKPASFNTQFNESKTVRPFMLVNLPQGVIGNAASV